MWGMKIIALEESADFATLDTEKLFSKLKSHELCRKGHPNHDAPFSSKALITGAHVGGHVANPTNTTDSSALEFALSSLCAASDEQYESIPDDEIALLARKFRVLHRSRKERRRSPWGCFECGDTTHFIANCPKRKKADSSNKYNYNNRNDSSDKGEVECVGDHVRLLDDLPNGTTLAQEIVASSIFPVTEILAIKDHKLDNTFLHITVRS
jgi:hypothetical protein